jgi:hypothetical protein
LGAVAALFHLMYSTDLFQDFALPIRRRSEVQALIGERAEYLVYDNCAMLRDTFDAIQQQVDGLISSRIA